jgi:hypothetical protein
MKKGLGLAFLFFVLSGISFLSCDRSVNEACQADLTRNWRFIALSNSGFQYLPANPGFIVSNLSDMRDVTSIPAVRGIGFAAVKVLPIALPDTPVLVIVHSFDKLTVCIGDKPRFEYTAPGGGIPGTIRETVIPLYTADADNSLMITGYHSGTNAADFPGRIYAVCAVSSNMLAVLAPELKSVKLESKKWRFMTGDSPVDAHGVPVWTYSGQAEWSSAPPSDRPEQGYEWLSKTLPPGDYDNPALYFMTFYPAFEVYSGSNRIYSFGTMPPFPVPVNHRLTHHTIPLPMDYAEHPIYFRIAYDTPNALVILDLELTEYQTGAHQGEDTLNSVVGKGAFYIFSFIAFLTLSVIFLMVYLIRIRHSEKIFLYISLFFFSFSLNDLSSSYFLPFFFGVLPYYNNQLMAVTYLLTSPFLAAFYRELFGMGIWKKLLLVVIIVQSAIAAVYIPLSFLQVLTNDFWLADQFIRAVEILFSIGAILYYIMHTPKNNKKAILLISLIAMGFATILNLMMNINLIAANFMFVDILLFVHFILLGIVMILNIDETQRDYIIIQQEVDIARKIHASILPKLIPTIEGVKIQSRYLPMSGMAGDFYDFYFDHDGNLGVLVADVSGHGIPAAQIASMVKISFASHLDEIRHPDKLLRRMNRTLYGNVGNHFLTAGCIFLDTRAGTLHYANAGHPALIVHRRKKGNIITLKPKGGIIGYFEDQVYQTKTVSVESGDRIVLYTDGITECADSQGEEFGEEHLFRFMKFSDKMNSAEFCNELIHTLTRWRDRPNGFEDDVTLVMIDIL